MGAFARGDILIWNGTQGRDLQEGTGNGPFVVITENAGGESFMVGIAPWGDRPLDSTCGEVAEEYFDRVGHVDVDVDLYEDRGRGLKPPMKRWRVSLGAYAVMRASVGVTADNSVEAEAKVMANWEDGNKDDIVWDYDGII